MLRLWFSVCVLISPVKYSDMLPCQVCAVGYVLYLISWKDYYFRGVVHCGGHL